MPSAERRAALALDRGDVFRHAMRVAAETAAMSPDPHVQVGAVLMRADLSVAGTGYNHVPAGTSPEYADRDLRRSLVVHAETMALAHVTPRDVDNGVLVTTLHPCAACLGALALYGVRGVVYAEMPDPSTYDPELLSHTAGRLGIITLHLPEETP